MAPNTFAKVATSLGDEMLVLANMSGQEALGRPFKYELDLFSLDANISLEDIIGTSVTVQIELQEGKYRFINGIASSFACVGMSGRFTRYHATLRPWFWLLTRSTDCRIFQNETVPDVIKKVFRDHGASDFDENLGRSYRQWEYIVQYRESAFNFVTRLMEQEGIYYYFKHEDGKHTLYLTDYYSGHKTAEGYEEIPYFPPLPGEQRERDHIDGWRVSQEIQAGRFALNDFNFKMPKAGMVTALNAPTNKGEFEVYDYPGEYDELSDGEDYTRVRMEQAASRYEIVEGQGNARGLSVGSHFVLSNHPRKDQNREYLVTMATMTLDTGEHETTIHRTGHEPTYRCSFNALETNTPFRPARTTPKPEISGPQTAVVVGGPGDEIYTDSFGRVKVKFHWDRSETKNEMSSCWIRVAQIWAGTNWGAVHIPRVGHEVVVEFIEGDPDRPLVTGRVYNANNMPPYDLPQHKTQSGVKSRSSKGGALTNFNELRFEDKKGEEQLFVQAEKNMDTLVKNDQTLTVKANRKKDITKDETTTIGQNRKELVTLNETIEIGGDRAETVTGSEKIDIVAGRTEHVIGPESITLDAGRTTTILGGDTETITGNVTTNITGMRTETVTGMVTQTATGGFIINTPAAVTISAAGGFNLVAPGGTTTVDSFFSKTGGATSDAFAVKLSVVGAKTELVAGLALGVTMNKVDMVSMKVDLAKTKFANNQVSIKSAGTAIMQGYCNLHTFGLVVIA
ncbi:MAG TPA: type VI secretion system tip protein TssI/VgrG [Polyangiales bacterium]|nr:type VI secretion system tip protein TssI/VgrG [Polyangiales bacterium]